MRAYKAFARPSGSFGRKMALASILGLLFVLWWATSAEGSAYHSAVITGVVRDAKHNGISMATVRVYDRDGAVIREGSTNITGTYRFDLFGNYAWSEFAAIEVVRDGYRTVRTEFPEVFPETLYFRFDAVLRELPVMTVPDRTTISEGLMMLRLVVNDQGKMEGRITWGGSPMRNQNVVWAQRKNPENANALQWSVEDEVLATIATNDNGEFTLPIDDVRVPYLLVVVTPQFTYYQPVQFVRGR